MKIVPLVLLLVIISLLVSTACAPEDVPPLKEDAALSDQEILQQYPDDMDAALADLEEIDGLVVIDEQD